MSHIYQAQERTAQAIIKSKGTTALLIRQGAPTGPAYDLTAGSETTETIRCVLTNWNQREIDGNLIQVGDLRLLVSTEGVTSSPNTEDGVRIGTEDYQVVSVRNVSPAGTPLVWIVQVRQ